MTEITEPQDTTMSPTIAKLADALSKAQGAFEHAKKGVENSFFKSRYADLASVIDAAREPLSKHGLAVIQTTKTIDGKVTLITMLVHSSGEWIRGEYPLLPVKNDPQGLGSVFTYGRRYCFSAITGIAADDDDGNAASGNSKPKESLASRNRRYEAVKAAIETSEDPTVAWQENLAEINEFKATVDGGDLMYENLVKTGQTRKQELLMKEQLGDK